MGISLGGIMRGGLPVLSDRLRRNENIKETAILKIGEKFGQLKNKVDEADAKNRTYMNNVETVAKSLAMDKDVVYNVFKAYGGNNKTAMNHLKNLANAYVAKGKPVPTMASAQTEQMLPKKEDATISVDTSKKDEDMNVFDKAMNLFKTAGPDEIFKEFMKRNPQLNETEVRKIMSNTMNPAYSPSKTIDPKAFIATLDAEEKNKKVKYGRFGYLDDGVLKLVAATRSNPAEFKEDQLRIAAEMPKQLSLAQSLYENGDTDKANQIFEAIESSLVGIFPTAIEKGADKAALEIKNIVDNIMANNPEANREKVVQQVTKFKNAQNVSVKGTPAKIMYGYENGDVTTSTVMQDNFVYRSSTGASIVSNLNPEDRDKNMDALKINSKSLADIGKIITKLDDTPLAFVSVINNIVKTVSTSTDVMNGLFNSNINLLEGTKFDAEKFIALNQTGIKLIASAKDQLFNDPRLSDRDLAIVLDYVAIIQRNIGSTQAIASMYGLQTALLKDSALRMAQNNNNLALEVPLSDAEIQANIPFKLEEGGKLINKDTTISTKLMHSAAASMGFSIMTQEQAMKLPYAAREKYADNMNLISAQVKDALVDLRIYRTLSSSEQQAYAGKTTGNSTDSYNVIPNSSNKNILRAFNRKSSFLVPPPKKT